MANSNNVVDKVHIMTPDQLIRLLTATIPNKLPVMVAGMPGVGKTMIGKQVAANLKHDLLIMHPVVSDPTDAKGMPWIFFDDEKNQPKALFVPFAELEQMMSATVPTIVMLDDLGQAPPAVQAAFMQLILAREINGKKISDNVVFLACTNRKEDRAGVSGILEPVKSRFVCIIELIPDLKSWVKWARAYGIEPEVIAFVQYSPWVLEGGKEGFKPSADMVNSPCPRTIEHLDKLVKLKLDQDLRPAAYAGCVGAAAATEYTGFERTLNQLPDMNIVLSNPGAADAPTSKMVQYAMVGVFHRVMDKGNIDNIYRYIDMHFSLELQMTFHFGVEAYNQDLIKTKGYVQWSAEHGDDLSN